MSLCWCCGHGMRSGAHGTGAGCAIYVGIWSPGIRTETPQEYTVICIKTKQKCWMAEDCRKNKIYIYQ